MPNVRGKGLARIYSTTFLASRLSRLFTQIETDEQRILHNDICEDVLELINTGPQDELLSEAESGLLRVIARYLLYKQFNERDFQEVYAERKKRFMFRMAEHIMHLASMKGQRT